MNYPDDRRIDKASAVETIVVLAIATVLATAAVEILIRLACRWAVK